MFEMIEPGTTFPIETYFMQKPKHLPRITTKTIDAPAFDLYGIADVVKTGDEGKGAWIQFRGQFEAELPDGRLYVSERCHVPGDMQDEIFLKWNNLGGAESHAAVQFALRIERTDQFVVAGVPAYRVTQLAPIWEFNPMTLLREAVRARNPELFPDAAE